MVFLRTGARGTFVQKSVIIILAFICIASLLANREKVSSLMTCGTVSLQLNLDPNLALYVNKLYRWTASASIEAK